MASPPPVVFTVAAIGIMSEARSSRTLSPVSVVSSTPWPTLGRNTSTFTAVPRPTKVHPSGGSMARTEGRGGGGGGGGRPESVTPESPASGCPPPSVHEVRNPHPPSPPSPPGLTPSLQDAAPTRAVTIAAAAAQRPALLMSVVVRPACAPAHRPTRLPESRCRKVGLPARTGNPSLARLCSPVRGQARPRCD